MRDRKELLKRISVDPLVCFGRPVVRGTRIWVSLILDNLAEGTPQVDLLAAYPQLGGHPCRVGVCRGDDARTNHSDPDRTGASVKLDSSDIVERNRTIENGRSEGKVVDRRTAPNPRTRSRRRKWNLLNW